MGEREPEKEMWQKQRSERERFEDGRSGHEPKKAGGLQKLEKTRKQILP